MPDPKSDARMSVIDGNVNVTIAYWRMQLRRDKAREELAYANDDMVSDERREVSDGKTLTLSLKSSRFCQEKTPDTFSVPSLRRWMICYIHAVFLKFADKILSYAIELFESRAVSVPSYCVC